MHSDKTLGQKLHMVSNLLDRRMNNIVCENGAEDITPMHGMILGYLCRQDGREIYQKDVEAEFNIARSTVTSTLKLMERKGYLLREGVAHDARLKRIVPTPLGRESFERVFCSIRQTELLMRSAMSDGEFQQLMRLLDKLLAVL